MKEEFFLPVKVILKASFTAIVGWENEELKIRLSSPPEKGKANNELIAFLAKTLKLPKSHIKLISGEKSRHKKLLISGIDHQTFCCLIKC